MKKVTQTEPYGNTWESEVGDDGEFVRHNTGFRSQIRSDGSTDFSPASGRYHLYVSYACPWAHRTLITRVMKGLEEAITSREQVQHAPITSSTLSRISGRGFM